MEGLEGLKELGRFEITFLDEDNAITDQVIKDTEEYKVIEKELKEGKELAKHLDFSDGALMSGFDYKGQQIVAMPLEECDKLMKKDKALAIVKAKQVNIELFNRCESCEEYNYSLEDYPVSFSIANRELIEDEFNLLKEVLK